MEQTDTCQWRVGWGKLEKKKVNRLAKEYICVAYGYDNSVVKDKGGGGWKLDCIGPRGRMGDICSVNGKIII